MHGASDSPARDLRTGASIELVSAGRPKDGVVAGPWDLSPSGHGAASTEAWWVTLMASPTKKLIGVLAIAMLLAMILAGVGCGNSDDGTERAVQWGVDRQLGPRALRLGATVEVCWAPVQLEQAIVEYVDDRGYIELRHTPEKGEGDYRSCPLTGPLTLYKAITLDRDLDELVLFDSSTDPPEMRWPTERPLPPERRWPGE